MRPPPRMMPQSFDLWCRLKVQRALDYCGKKFGLTKRAAIINVTYTLIALELVGLYQCFTLLPLRDLWFAAIVIGTNIASYVWVTPKIIRVSCDGGEQGVFITWILLDFYRWIVWFFLGGNRIGDLLGIIKDLLHHKPIDVSTQIVVFFVWGLMLLWAYVASGNDPPPKERKETFTKLAYQGR